MTMKYTSELKTQIDGLIALVGSHAESKARREASVLAVCAGLGGARLTHIEPETFYWSDTVKLQNILKAAQEWHNFQKKALPSRQIKCSEDQLPKLIRYVLTSAANSRRRTSRRQTNADAIAIKLMPSLELAISELRESCQTWTHAQALLTFAGRGQARLMLDNSGNPVWTCCISLLLDFNSIVSGGSSVPEGSGQLDWLDYADKRGTGNSSWPKQQRMDGVLEKLIGSWYDTVSPQCRVPKSVVAIDTLVHYEANGRALPSRDSDGELSWKATDALRREEDEDSDDDDDRHQNDEDDETITFRSKQRQIGGSTEAIQDIPPLGQRHPAFADDSYLFFQYSRFGQSWQRELLEKLVFHFCQHESITIEDMYSALHSTLKRNRTILEQEGGRTFRAALASFKAFGRMREAYEREQKIATRKKLKVIHGGLKPK
jgi:hypothetical protein